MVRVYPHGKRIKSSNYNPLPAWVVGAQLVALNVQTMGEEMYINQARTAAAVVLLVGEGGCLSDLFKIFLLRPVSCELVPLPAVFVIIHMFFLS